MPEPASAPKRPKSGLPGVDVAFGAVERDPVTLVEDVLGDSHLLLAQIHVHSAAADDAAPAPAAGDESRVAGHAAALSQDRLGGTHALDILRVGLFADEDDLLALFVPVDGFGGGEYHLAGGATGTGGQAFG